MWSSGRKLSFMSLERGYQSMTMLDSSVYVIRKKLENKIHMRERIRTLFKMPMKVC